MKLRLQIQNRCVYEAVNITPKTKIFFSWNTQKQLQRWWAPRKIQSAGLRMFDVVAKASNLFRNVDQFTSFDVSSEQHFLFGEPRTYLYVYDFGRYARFQLIKGEFVEIEYSIDNNVEQKSNKVVEFATDESYSDGFSQIEIMNDNRRLYRTIAAPGSLNLILTFHDTSPQSQIEVEVYDSLGDNRDFQHRWFVNVNKRTRICFRLPHVCKDRHK